MTTVDAYAPLYRTAPDWAETDGDLAATLATDLGWELDGVQRFVVDACLADDGTGLPACGSVAVVGPRQTVGKTVAMQVAALFDVFLFDVALHVWTAHRYSTAEKTFEDMRRRILSIGITPGGRGSRTGRGSSRSWWTAAGVLEFHARSGKAGPWLPRRLPADPG
jgi:hypothetical protein